VERQKILIVDDDVDLRLAEGDFEHAGYDMLVAASKSEGWRRSGRSSLT
jgi:hypothetical protein